MPGGSHRSSLPQRDGLQPVRCKRCGHHLPGLVKLTEGSVVSLWCKDCKTATVKVGRPPPHWS
jgi:hypothetical protein